MTKRAKLRRTEARKRALAQRGAAVVDAREHRRDEARVQRLQLRPERGGRLGQDVERVRGDGRVVLGYYAGVSVCCVRG